MQYSTNVKSGREAIERLFSLAVDGKVVREMHSGDKVVATVEEAVSLATDSPMKPLRSGGERARFALFAGEASMEMLPYGIALDLTAEDGDPIIAWLSTPENYALLFPEGRGDGQTAQDGRRRAEDAILAMLGLN